MNNEAASLGGEITELFAKYFGSVYSINSININQQFTLYFYIISLNFPFNTITLTMSDIFNGLNSLNSNPSYDSIPVLFFIKCKFALITKPLFYLLTFLSPREYFLQNGKLYLFLQFIKEEINLVYQTIIDLIVYL